MRLVYFGTPDIAVSPLRALHAAGHDVVLVVSGADKRRGRGTTLSPSPVKSAALELGLAVTADIDDVLEVDADLGVVVAYGRIIGVRYLERLQMVNLHFSLLPRWRGAAPVERAILAGDELTGVCVMAVEEGLDTGGVYARTQLELDDRITAAQLRSQLTDLGTRLLVDTLAAGLGTPEPQPDDGVTYAEKVRSADLLLDWDRPIVDVLRVVRVGGAWTTFRTKRFKVLGARPGRPEDPVAAAEPGTFVEPTLVAGGGGWCRLETVQPEGKAPMDAAAWANGARPVGERLGS